MNKQRYDRLASLTGKQLSEIFKYMPQAELKDWARNRFARSASRVAKKELLKRRTNGEV